MPSLTPLLEMQTDNSPANYTYDALGMKQYPLSSGTITRRYSRIFEGKVPSKILIGFFSQSSFSGERNKTPLLTAPVDVRSISLSLNGVSVRELQVDYESGLYMEAYQQLIQWMDKRDKRYLLKYHNFPQGYRYYAFNLMANCEKSSNCSEETLSQGYIDVNVSLRSALKGEDVVMAVFYLSPQSLYINKERVARFETAVI